MARRPHRYAPIASVLTIALCSAACPFSFDPAGGDFRFDAGEEIARASDGGAEVDSQRPSIAMPPPVMAPNDAGVEDKARLNPDAGPDPMDSGHMMPPPPPHMDA